ncbi:HSP18 transcriptional regulator [Amycolatopsis suaedae]|uniref:HSP18 transcriptional regulator n=1 Tax=Amycolatopsis suaedae TaxID=2510978 RepID=A0A4Q7J1W9_9PSEU|nr:HSP18 transcriptional regulator [Amycolatopsis suaedae]RZQ60496.1 HSP18 transcriptional regulator [Amycolatopsis suaedae]
MADQEFSLPESLALIQAARLLARDGGELGPEAVAALLPALEELRRVRDELASWEPELIAAARAAGSSWAALAPALGVASRQAAERRFLRLRPGGEATAEGRVRAERNRRAGDRAVSAWAREHAAELRQLAAEVSSVDGPGADRLRTALGEDDAAGLLAPLAERRPHLADRHARLADRIGTVTDDADRVRRDAGGQV